MLHCIMGGISITGILNRFVRLNNNPELYQIIQKAIIGQDSGKLTKQKTWIEGRRRHRLLFYEIAPLFNLLFFCGC